MSSVAESARSAEEDGDTNAESLIGSDREAYLRAIETHAKQSTLQTLYPGQDYEDLRRFLARGPLTARPGSIPFAELYTIENGMKPVISRYHDSLELVGDMKNNIEASKAQILFLKGYPSSEWLLDVGALFQIDPEFFRLHLQFRNRKEYDASPPLPSSLEHIFRLKIYTVGSREDKQGLSRQDELDKLRSQASEAKRLYEHNLERAYNCRRGDSIVRDYHVLDEKHFVVEQNMSVCLNRVAESWSIVILTDIGNDLSQGPVASWLSMRDREFPTPWTRLYPVGQHRHGIALEPKESYTTEGGCNTSKTPQSATLLADHYAEFADLRLLGKDPFYALDELFKFAAHAECIALATVETKINAETGYAVTTQQRHLTLSNLLYFQDLLLGHLAMLHENIDFVKRRGHRSWPQVSNTDDDGLEATAQLAAETLLKDFEYLQFWAKSLYERCTQGTTVIMNNAMLAQSERAGLQAEGLRKLTLVAFFYIPLSFTASFFGMNFRQLGQGNLSVWIWFLVATPVLILSITFLLWDYWSLYISSKELLRRFMSKFY